MVASRRVQLKFSSVEGKFMFVIVFEFKLPLFISQHSVFEYISPFLQYVCHTWFNIFTTVVSHIFVVFNCHLDMENI